MIPFVLVLSLMTDPVAKVTLDFNTQDACNKAQQTVQHDVRFKVVEECHAKVSK